MLLWKFFLSLRRFYTHLITSAVGWIAPLLMPLWCKFHGLMQRICLLPSTVTLALFMKQFILHEFYKEEKTVDCGDHHWLLFFVFLFFFFLDVKWKGRPRMEVQKFLSSCTEKARVTKGSSEKAGEYAMAHQTWTDESTWDPHPWPLMCTRSLTIWASHVQFLLVTGVSGR